MPGRSRASFATETVRRGDGAHHDGSETADGAAAIEQHVLRGGTRRGGVKLAHECAMAANHAVYEEAHDGARDQRRGRTGQPRIKHHHDSRAQHPGEEGRLTARAVGGLAESEYSNRHAQYGHRGPCSGLCETDAESRGEIARQPDHHAIITEVLHRAENDHADRVARLRCVRHQKVLRRFRGPVSGLRQRSESMPKPTPPPTAPIGVAVTSDVVRARLKPRPVPRHDGFDRLEGRHPTAAGLFVSGTQSLA